MSQHGYSLLELFKNDGTEKRSVDALLAWKWPDRFTCSKCASRSYCSLKSSDIYPCNPCHQQISVTASTIFEHTKLPLTICFLSLHLITQANTRISAAALAWKIKQKIMPVMKERDDEQKLSGKVQIDAAYERHGGKRSVAGE